MQIALPKDDRVPLALLAEGRIARLVLITGGMMRCLRWHLKNGTRRGAILPEGQRKLIPLM